MWGLTWLPVKVASAEVPPVFLAAVRFTLAGAVFLAWSGLKRARVPGGLLPRMLLSALAINTGNYALLFWGIAHAPTGLAAVVNLASIPIFTLLLALLYREDVATPARLGAIALGLLGLIFLFWTKLQRGEGDATVPLALGAIVVGTLSYSWGAILSRPLLRAMHPLGIAAWQCLVGGFSLALLSLALEPVTVASLGKLLIWPVWPAVLFLVVGGSLVGFAVYLMLLRDWGPFRAGLYCFVSPVIAVAVGVFVLGEPFGLNELVGSLLMFGATALAVLPRRRSAAP
jgi:drug/metabolite transporter (DMT)-like permease